MRISGLSIKAACHAPSLNAASFVTIKCNCRGRRSSARTKRALSPPLTRRANKEVLPAIFSPLVARRRSVRRFVRLSCTCRPLTRARGRTAASPARVLLPHEEFLLARESLWNVKESRFGKKALNVQNAACASADIIFKYTIYYKFIPQSFNK